MVVEAWASNFCLSSISIPNSEHLIKLFKGGGSFIFVIKQREGSASEYKFKLKDTSGFALAWDQLYKKN